MRLTLLCSDLCTSRGTTEIGILIGHSDIVMIGVRVTKITSGEPRLIFSTIPNHCVEQPWLLLIGQSLPIATSPVEPCLLPWYFLGTPLLQDGSSTKVMRERAQLTKGCKCCEGARLLPRTSYRNPSWSPRTHILHALKIWRFKKSWPAMLKRSFGEGHTQLVHAILPMETTEAAWLCFPFVARLARLKPEYWWGLSKDVWRQSRYYEWQLSQFLRHAKWGP